MLIKEAMRSLQTRHSGTIPMAMAGEIITTTNLGLRLDLWMTLRLLTLTKVGQEIMILQQLK